MRNLGIYMKNSESDRLDINSFPMTRRRLLGYGAGVAAASLAATLLPPNVQRALAAGPATPSSWKDIKHVVLLMQENRSFDHYFGTMAGVRGFDDPNALTLSTGKSVFYQPDAINPDGYILPFHLDTLTSSAQRIPSTSHSWEVQHESWNGGKMDQWLEAHRKADRAAGPYVMGYYNRADIPFQFALAEAFTVCDSYHSSLLGPTWPNRLYWMTGTIDADGKNGGPVMSNSIPHLGYGWTTYPERLEQAGVSWKVYHQEPDSFGLNVLGLFASYRQAKPGSALYDKAMAISPVGQFESDAMNDRLPAVSWILPPQNLSEHPSYTAADGAAFVASKIDAIAANPEVWAKTVFILDYDENDGLYDHVAPPTPPAGTAGEFVQGVQDGNSFRTLDNKAPIPNPKNLPVESVAIGAGFRVPCIIVSPWTAGGWVCSHPFDHTSVLQFLEKFTGVQETNISDWRRQTFGDMTAAFRFGTPIGKPPVLPDAAKLLVQSEYEMAYRAPVLPGANQTPPVQEKKGAGGQSAPPAA
jgi:phospholipase C